MKSMYIVGSRVKVSSENDNDSYDSFRDKNLIVTAVSRSTEDHPGFDEGADQELYDLKDAETGEAINCSLYEYELQGR